MKENCKFDPMTTESFSIQGVFINGQKFITENVLNGYRKLSALSSAPPYSRNVQNQPTDKLIKIIFFGSMNNELHPTFSLSLKITSSFTKKTVICRTLNCTKTKNDTYVIKMHIKWKCTNLNATKTEQNEITCIFIRNRF